MARIKHPWYRYHRDWRTGGKERFVRDWNIKVRDNRIVSATHKKTGVKQHTPFGKARKRSKHNRKMAQQTPSYRRTDWSDPVQAMVANDMNKDPDWWLGKVSYDRRGHKYAVDDDGFSINPRSYATPTKKEIYQRKNLIPIVAIPIGQQINAKRYNRDEHPHNKFMTWGVTNSGRTRFFNKKHPGKMQQLARYGPKPELGGLGMKGRTAWILGYLKMKRDYKK